MATRAGSICLVTPELYSLDDGGELGMSTWQLAQLLAGEGWRTHILYCGSTTSVERLACVSQCPGRGGIEFTSLDQVSYSPVQQLPHWFADFDKRSMRVMAALEQLHRLHRFDLIQFAEWLGLGFPSLQAKQSGLGFADVGVIVKLHGCSQWRREEGYHWMGHALDLLQDHCERHAFEHADFRLSSSQYLLDYTNSLGWSGLEETVILPNPLPPLRGFMNGHSKPWPPEVVYCGELEPRAGLRIF